MEEKATMLAKNRIALGATAVDKQDAIRQVGKLLVDDGCVSQEYVDGMLQRESTMSTYLGNGVAIPHGMHENRVHILRSGLSIVQFPQGVLWEEEDDEVAWLVIGIAASGDEHVGVLASLAEVIEDEATVEILAKTDDKQVILDYLSTQPEP